MRYADLLDSTGLWASYGLSRASYRPFALCMIDCTGVPKPVCHPHEPVYAPFGTRREHLGNTCDHVAKNPMNAHRPPVCI